MIDRVRFSGASWFNAVRADSVMVVGAGGIGSHLLLQLSRLGPAKIVVYDDDIVDSTNMGGQMLLSSSINQTKVNAISVVTKAFSDYTITGFREKYTQDSMYNPVVFSAVDSMKSRMDIYKRWAREDDRRLLIDGRMNAELFEIYVVTPGREERYEKTLVDDSTLPDELCIFKSTSYMGAGIAFAMTNIYVNFMSGGAQLVPFSWKYYSIIMKNEQEW